MDIFVRSPAFLLISRWKIKTSIDRVKWHHSNLWSWYYLYAVLHDVLLCKV